MKPAMTPKQWEKREVSVRTAAGGAVHTIEVKGRKGKRRMYLDESHYPASAAFYEEEGAGQYAEFCHALAALALQGQYFGFTWEDVEELRALSETVRKVEGATPKHWVWMETLADRIAALLPPGGE